MNSIFDYANFLFEQDVKRGNYKPATTYVELAIDNILSGYSSLEEANEESNTRIDPWGNEISPLMVHEAAMFKTLIFKNC